MGKKGQPDSGTTAVGGSSSSIRVSTGEGSVQIDKVGEGEAFSGGDELTESLGLARVKAPFDVDKVLRVSPSGRYIEVYQADEWPEPEIHWPQEVEKLEAMAAGAHPGTDDEDPGDTLRLIRECCSELRVKSRVSGRPLSNTVRYGIDKRDISYLLGQVLTQIDATFTDVTQRDCQKDLFKQMFGRWFDQLTEEAEADAFRDPRPIRSMRIQTGTIPDPREAGL